MAIMDETDTLPIPVPKPAGDPPGVQARVTAPSYRGMVVDTREINLSALLVYVEGSSWTTNYYSQLVDADEEIGPQQTDQHAVHQQYVLIKGLELKVTSPLTQTQDIESGAFTITGTAICYPGTIIPNQGDMFLADVGDGREGVFTLMEVERKTILKDTCYELQYRLVEYSTPERRADFEKKTIRVFHFRKDFYVYGQNPLVVTEEVVAFERLKTEIKNLVTRYMLEFFNTDFRLLLMPNIDRPTYDHYLNRFFVELFNTRDYPLVGRMRILNDNNDDNFIKPTIWEMIQELNLALMPVASKKMDFVKSEEFGRWTIYGGLFHSGVDYVVYPLGGKPMTYSPCSSYIPETDGSTFFPLGEGEESPYPPGSINTILLSDLMGIPVEPVEPPPLEPQPPATMPVALPVIHPVGIDDYYVFSEAFYQSIPEQYSAMELVVRNALLGEANNTNALLSIAADSLNWLRMERFYYVPALVAVLMIQQRRLSV